MLLRPYSPRLFQTKVGMKALRLAGASIDGSAYSESIDKLNGARSKYSVYDESLFKTKGDRKLQKKATAPSSATVDLNAYRLLREKAKFRIVVGRLMFSAPVERFFFLLIILFAGVVVVTVALQDNLGGARVYLLVLQLVILVFFFIEVVLKLIALGLVFLRACWNVVDVVIILLSIVLTILELIPDVQSIDYLQISAILRLFRLVFTFRKTTEFRRIQRKLRKPSISQDFAVEMAYERVVELLNSLLLEPWVKINSALATEVEWCIDVISSNKIYETILTIKRESRQLKEKDLVNIVRLFSSTPRPESRASNPRKRTSSIQHEGNQTLDVKSGLSTGVLTCLNEIDTNVFDVFLLKELTEGNELVTLMHAFFSRAELYLTAQIEPVKFSNFIRSLQMGYHVDNPYHNSTHAADVVQAIHFFLGTCGVDDYLSLTPVELAGAYLAAAMHDYDHPGVNNAYLINTQAELAFRYNDRSVLESHHVASAFTQTLQADKDLFEDLSKDDYRLIREQIIDMVLSTDIAQHFTLLTKFRTKFVDNLAELKTEDRTLALSLLLHAADISNPSRPWPVCAKWASLIMEEFWAQGDRERNQGLPVTYMMDRYSVSVAKSQVGFIDVIVSPVLMAFRELLPKFEGSCGMLLSNKEIWSKKIVEEPEELESNVTKDVPHV